LAAVPAERHRIGILEDIQFIVEECDGGPSVRSPVTVVEVRSALTEMGLPFSIRATIPELPVVA
jgi:hypothetical protein